MVAVGCHSQWSHVITDLDEVHSASSPWSSLLLRRRILTVVDRRNLDGMAARALRVSWLAAGRPGPGRCPTQDCLDPLAFESLRVAMSWAPARTCLQLAAGAQSAENTSLPTMWQVDTGLTARATKFKLDARCEDVNRSTSSRKR